jgi:hypothetical protein
MLYTNKNANHVFDLIQKNKIISNSSENLSKKKLEQEDANEEVHVDVINIEIEKPVTNQEDQINDEKEKNEIIKKVKIGIFENYVDSDINTLKEPFPDFKSLVHKSALENFDSAMHSLLNMFYPISILSLLEQEFLYFTNNVV